MTCNRELPEWEGAQRVRMDPDLASSTAVVAGQTVSWLRDDVPVYDDTSSSACCDRAVSERRRRGDIC